MGGWVKKRKVMRLYDATARIYDSQYAEEQAAKIEAAMTHLGKRKLGIVLDVGCGTGILFPYIADNAEAVVGIDISRKTLTEAKRCAGRFWNVSLMLADADYLPFMEDVFDEVFAMTLIQNMPFPADTLKEISRTANTSSVFVITGLKKIFSRAEFESLLDNVGLQTVTLEDDERLKCFIAICTKVQHQKQTTS